jgi:hypothetical protein
MEKGAQPGLKPVKPESEPGGGSLFGVEDIVYFDLRSSDYTYRPYELDVTPSHMTHINSWIFAAMDSAMYVGYINPVYKVWAAQFGMLNEDWLYVYYEGTCIDITEQPPEKPTEGKD